MTVPEDTYEAYDLDWQWDEAKKDFIVVKRNVRMVSRRQWTQKSRYERTGASMRKSHQVMSDIEPYKAVAVDTATGEKPIIGGRAQHREFLKRNDYVEVGNEWKSPRRSELSQAERIADIKRSMGE